MKRTAVLILALAGLLSAAPTYYIIPGPWWMCSLNGGYPGCAQYTPDTEGYELLIATANPNVVAYTYTVSAVLNATGETVTRSGLVARSVQIDTLAMIYFGGPAHGFTIAVTDLVPAGER